MAILLNHATGWQLMQMEEPPKVLILEDDLTTSSALGAMLARHGYRPVMAHSVHEAMNLMGDPAYAILDLLLPDGSGMEVLREIRDKHPSTRVLISSGCCDPATEQEIHQMGVALHAKPMSFQRILDWLQTA